LRLHPIPFVGAALLIALVGSPRPAWATTVPFVGCPSDGQTGPEDAPANGAMVVDISPALAPRLAAYGTGPDFFVLAPRAWHCLVVSGSNGASLYIAPAVLTDDFVFSVGAKGFGGPAIQLSTSHGETSGRFRVARVAARLFPSRWPFVRSVMAEGIEQESTFVFWPFPGDQLTYQSELMLEFRTPPNARGLGTESRLDPNGDPIAGIVLLQGPAEEPTLHHLSVRLSGDMIDILPIILKHTGHLLQASETR